MTTARYRVLYGLTGCAVPVFDYGPICFHSRRELAAFIKKQLSAAEMPQRRFDTIGIRDLWQFIKHHGSSSAHFSVTHDDWELAFHGLTEEEAKENEDD